MNEFNEFLTAGGLGVGIVAIGVFVGNLLTDQVRQAKADKRRKAGLL